MSLVRTFIAIALPQTIQEKITLETSSIRDQVGSGVIRWVSSKNMHLTLRFLGETTIETVGILKGLLADTADKYPPMDISVDDFGVFPNSKRPRVLWVGLKYPPTLVKLQSEIEFLARQLKFEPENRPFSPHLTIGRVNRNATSNEVQALRNTLASFKVGQIGSFTANTIHFIRSDLQPTGAIYSTLSSAMLKNQYNKKEV